MSDYYLTQTVAELVIKFIEDSKSDLIDICYRIDVEELEKGPYKCWLQIREKQEDKVELKTLFETTMVFRDEYDVAVVIALLGHLKTFISDYKNHHACGITIYEHQLEKKFFEWECTICGKTAMSPQYLQERENVKYGPHRDKDGKYWIRCALCRMEFHVHCLRSEPIAEGPYRCTYFQCNKKDDKEDYSQASPTTAEATSTTTESSERS